MSWTVIDSATAFSTFSAVLAAFMFAAIVLLLTRELNKDLEPTLDLETIGQPLALMLSAFFSLVIAAFLFAAMAGETSKQDPLQFLEGSMPAIALSVGVVQMAVAIAWLLAIRSLGGSALELSGYVVDAAIVLVACFLPGTFLAASFEKLISKPHPDPGVEWGLLFGVLFLSIPIGRAAQHILRGRIFDHRNLVDPRFTRWIGIGTLALLIVAAVGWNVLSSDSNLTVDAVYATPGGDAWLVIATVALLVQLALAEMVAPRSPVLDLAPSRRKPTPSLPREKEVRTHVRNQ